MTEQEKFSKMISESLSNTTTTPDAIKTSCLASIANSLAIIADCMLGNTPKGDKK